MAGSTSASTRWQPDAVLSDRYRIEALLGEGGVASVYRALDLHGSKRVALKLLTLRSATHAALLTSQFEREYHTLSQLAHPSIIEVYDYGLTAAGPYYTMELLDGEDLRERGRLPFHEVCALLCDVASSLAIIHSRGRVHRDLSARNVRCTRQGRAKLLDFGAMVAIGSTPQLVGTPPFVPPEAVQLQPLDARVDLYGLGALAYFMLTGRHAYPATTLSQLRDLWRNAPASPQQLDASVPDALDDLVMELLQLERAARPRSAAEVMSRMAGIAGLPLQELPEVQRAYLAVPVLVGRQAELQQLRTGMIGALRSCGSSVLIEGAAGLGRTRLLDAAVLEAKLMGATVLRIAAAESGAGDYALVRQLCEGLQAALPVLVEQSARPRREILSYVLPDLADRNARSGAPERRQLQASLRDFILAVAREQLLVIAVDDLPSADESSAALLGLLAHGARRRKLCLVLSADSEAPPTAALTLMRELATRITLEPLRAEQTLSLVKSLFGDVEHSDLIAERIHELSDGNPRWIMALCERLIERGSVRYHAGRWSLPSSLDSDFVPSSLASAIAERIAALPEDARTLAETLAFTEPEVLLLPDYLVLADLPDHGRTYRALTALVEAGVLVVCGDRYRFRQGESAAQLRAGAPAPRICALHQRIADILTPRAVHGSYERALCAHHLLHAGRPRDAVVMAMPDVAALWLQWSPGNRLLERTLADALAQPAELGTRLRVEATLALVNLAALLGNRACVLRHGPELQQRLERDTGLSDFHTLTDMPQDARMTAALQRAQLRYAATPQDARVYSPQEAARPMAWLYTAFIASASVAQDPTSLEGLPSLMPLAEVLPEAAVRQQELEILIASQSGRFGRAIQKSMALVARVSGADHGGIDPIPARAARVTQLYTQGLLLAGAGMEVGAELLAGLERVAGYRAHAWRVRMVAELMQCNFEAAHDCERRAALVGVQDGVLFPGTTVRLELMVHVLADNLAALHPIVERCAELAETYPGWRPTHAIARCHQLRLQNEPQAALLALAPALELTAPGRHMDWEPAVQSHMQVLCALGRAGDAVAVGREALARAAACKLAVSPQLRVAMALAWLDAGEVAAAHALASEMVGALVQARVRGLRLGLAHEACARVAVARRDSAGLREAAEQCARLFKIGENAVLNARFERLLRDASVAGVALPHSIAWTAAHPTEPSSDVPKTVYSRMLTCIGPNERSVEVLRLILEETAARSGYLFGLRTGRLELLARVDDEVSPDGLVATLEAYLRDELSEREPVDGSAVASASSAPRPRLPAWIDSWGREFTPLLVAGVQHGEEVVAAIAALHCEHDEAPVVRAGLMQALTDALIADDVIDPITCVG